ncbi:Putative AAA+ ATPase domain, ATPase, AAA-type, core [Septoria linicola]|uniref:AAA+ ATPase domain, ATPase, AAA-type, core n=1 Tax=Septoria linicola TaxID=215465 RepID=A0A9Q9ANP8_9PEZI|nr:Putative AAA+ ATPase domain, ATPase, AAA-type, core [Septoria linicola]
MNSSSPAREPTSDELAEIYASQGELHSSATLPTDVEDADALDALNATKRVQPGEVINHRNRKTNEIFHSEPREPHTSSPVQMANVTSSPSTTPSPQKRKRKLDQLDFGKSSLGASRPAKAQKFFYGIDIHRLLADAEAEDSIPKPARTTALPTPPAELATSKTKKGTLLWTEKYRAKKYADLIGDERTHRNVMHWLKRWDQIVFPGSYRPKTKKKFGDTENEFVERPHRKILMLTGPPGLGKTTLAHVCAKQAGYEVQEINASDERSSNVVKGRIRDMVGTENVKNVEDKKTADGLARKAAKPVCVIVDEVDGVVGGSGSGGEGGFVKALIDLILLDQKNTSALGTLSQAPTRKKKGDKFRLLRPLILVCNDVYHPSLRPLRQSNLAEVIHVRKAPVQSVTTRLQTVFEKEGIPCDGDGVRRLCEAAWGVSNRKEDKNGNGAGEGDMRGIMVVGEWVAGKLRATGDSNTRLTRKWVEDNILRDLTHGGGGARGMGRGSPKDIVDRVFKEGAGFPRQAALATPLQHAGSDGVKGVAEGLRRTATERLRELIDTHGDTDRIMTDCFSSYPEHQFQDDTYLSKPDAAYEWLNFHDRLSGAVFSSNEWELAPYLSTSVLGFHHLFASATTRQYFEKDARKDNDDADAEPPHPFSGPQASWAAHEATKQNESYIDALQSSLAPPLKRLFSSPADIATDLQPYLLRMLTPNINPIIVGGSGKDKSTASVRKASEQTLVRRAVNAMGASGVRFDRVRLDDSGSSSNQNFGSKTRYAVRQVIDQEWKKEEARLNEEQRLARFGLTNASYVDKSTGQVKRKTIENVDSEGKKIVRDFFGRVVVVPVGETAAQKNKREGKAKRRDLGAFVKFQDGYSNAVRKPISLVEFMRDL